MTKPMISVIIPVYKVEPYLRKCLDSVAGQTYQNLEIILVDDGSPDNCGAICEEYAGRDARIQVIHRENGGLSAARNTGLEAASGAYLGFVDSDDWIEPDMYERMLSGLLRAEADISVCGRREEFRNRSVVRGWEREQALDTEQALGQLLKDQQMQNYVWDKLYRRELFQGIRFPEGRTFEDVSVQYQLFLRAKKVQCLPEAFYHYRQRPGSIMDDILLENKVNYYIASKQRCEELKEHWPQLTPYLEGQCVASAVSIWSSYLKNDRAVREKYWPEIHKISQFSKRHYRAALKYLGLGLAGKIVVCLTPYTDSWSFVLAYLCGWAYKKKNGRAL